VRADLSHDLQPGELVDGRFRIVEPLGMGGMGSVYRAQELASGEEVALKLLHGDVGEEEESRLRFEREARALAALRHPHVVPIRGFGLSGRTPYMVMELLQGQTLTHLLESEAPLAPERALHLAEQVIDAVAFIHTQGVIHRDLKSPNVMVEQGPDGDHVRVLDFGFAKFFDREKWEGEHTLTAKGAVFGTLAYMAPEQAMGARVDESADVYALGVLLFELLTGRRPYYAEDRQSLFEMHLQSPIPRLRDVRPELSVPAPFERLVRKALAKKPNQRFGNAAAMARTLRAVEAPTLGNAQLSAAQPRTGSRPPPMIVAAALLAVAATAALLMLLL